MRPYVVDGHTEPHFEDYIYYRYTPSTSTTQLISSRAGRIIAGGHASFSGNLKHDDSRILAGGLFNFTPDARYLIESDPRFAGYRPWLSSDYLLQALARDPATGSATVSTSST